MPYNFSSELRTLRTWLATPAPDAQGLVASWTRYEAEGAQYNNDDAEPSGRAYDQYVQFGVTITEAIASAFSDSQTGSPLRQAISQALLRLAQNEETRDGAQGLAQLIESQIGASGSTLASSDQTSQQSTF